MECCILTQVKVVNTALDLGVIVNSQLTLLAHVATLCWVVKTNYDQLSVTDKLNKRFSSFWTIMDWNTNLLHCSIDGPTINVAFLRRLNAHLESKQCPPLIDLGTCSLYPVHTAFWKGVEGLPFDVEHFVTDVYQWFKLSAARREDYWHVQAEDLEECVGKFLLKFVSSLVEGCIWNQFADGSLNSTSHWRNTLLPICALLEWSHQQRQATSG